MLPFPDPEDYTPEDWPDLSYVDPVYLSLTTDLSKFCKKYFFRFFSQTPEIEVLQLAIRLERELLAALLNTETPIYPEQFLSGIKSWFLLADDSPDLAYKACYTFWYRAVSILIKRKPEHQNMMDWESIRGLLKQKLDKLG